MSGTVVGGNTRYSNLQSIADLFRASINDTFSNSSGSGTGNGGGAGLVMPNSNPDLLTFMRSSIYEMFSDLRNVGDPELIVDNYILEGLPALTDANPAVQVGLSYAGYFDGFQWHAQWKLPTGAARILTLWERQTNSNENFQVMQQQNAGIGGYMQGQRMRVWEMREGMVWMPGCLYQTDIRIRARIGYPVALSPVNLNFDTTYVPILDCANAVVAKMLVLYAKRFAPENYQMALSEENRLMDKLKLESVRQMQSVENQRAAFGDEAVQDFAVTWSWL